MTDEEAPTVEAPPVEAILDAASTARIALTSEQIAQLLQGEFVSVAHPESTGASIVTASAEAEGPLRHLDALGSLVQDGLPIGGGWALGGSVEPGGLSLSLLKKF